jgi:DnaJ-class molecular chaperone
MSIKLTDPDSGETARFIECEICQGRGYIEHYYDEYDIQEWPCDACGGKGLIPIDF